MKRVTVLVPDDVVVSISASAGPSHVERLAVTPALMIRALTTNDYHEHVYFDRAVTVISIENEP